MDNLKKPVKHFFRRYFLLGVFSLSSFNAYAHLISVSPTTPLPNYVGIGSTTDALYTVRNNSSIPLSVVDQSISHQGLPDGLSLQGSSTCNAGSILVANSTCTLALQFNASNVVGNTSDINLYEYASPSLDGVVYPIDPIDVTSWTWVSGTNLRNQPGVYGKQGVASSSNLPGGRSRIPATWSGSSSDLWLFGGRGYDQDGVYSYLNDLWQFNINTNQWTWISGSKLGNALGNYGQQGVPSTANVPSAREGLISWADNSGNLWLFGGDGYDKNGSLNYLNDLWEFNPNTKEWTWVSGSNTGGQPGSYGTQGTPSINNIPGGRNFATSWIDHSGNFWLFGGAGYDKNGSLSYLNDLWEFNPNTKEWTWISGSNTGGEPGRYGVQGTASSANIPGARDSLTSWIDNSGTLWLFSGYGYDINGYQGALNDLWSFNPKTNQWTWVSGSNLIDQIGNYGVKGVPSTSNVPGARFLLQIKWTDSSGNLWVFGGYGYDKNGDVNNLGDLWQFNPNTGKWTWVSGSDTAGQTGNYGRQGTPGALTIPGSRQNPIGWVDNQGKFWLFGGFGKDTNGNSGRLNDLWRFDF